MLHGQRNCSFDILNPYERSEVVDEWHVYNTITCEKTGDFGMSDSKERPCLNLEWWREKEDPAIIPKPQPMCQLCRQGLMDK